MYRTSLAARLAHLGFIIQLLFGLALASCGPPSTTGLLKVTVVQRTASVSQIGLVSVSVPCASGQQLLGGGYEITQPRTGYPLVVEGSYPSPSNINPNIWDAWTAEVFNPDAPGSVVHIGNLVTVYAYCATTPNFPLGIVIKQAKTVISYTQNAPPANPTAVFGEQVNAYCPSNSALTGGGFRNQYKYAPTIGEHRIERSNVTTIESAPVAASVPFPSPSPSLQMWSVYGVDSGAAVTAYALCATQNLSATSPTLQEIHVTGDSSAPSPWRYYEGTVSCGKDQLATGGGYIFNNEHLWRKIIWRKAAWRDRAMASLSGWALGAGYELPTDFFARNDDTLHPTVEGMKVYVTCIQATTV